MEEVQTLAFFVVAALVLTAIEHPIPKVIAAVIGCIVLIIVGLEVILRVTSWLPKSRGRKTYYNSSGSQGERDYGAMFTPSSEIRVDSNNVVYEQGPSGSWEPKTIGSYGGEQQQHAAPNRDYSGNPSYSPDRSADGKELYHSSGAPPSGYGV